MEYTEGVRRQIQLTELEILLKFDEICRKHNINYQVFAGTLIGAVRHKGFIPWDDDIDVCMLREEYEKFLAIGQEELGDLYFLQTCQTDKDAILQFAKIRKNGTIFEMDNETSSESHKGIWIDIFPIDNVKPNTRAFKRQCRQFNFYYAIETSTMKSRVKASKKFWKRCVRRFFYFLSKIMGKKNIEKKLYKIITRFDGENTGYVNSLSNGASKDTVRRCLNLRQDFIDTIELDFEGHKVLAPKNYDRILTICYGNYMQPPPVEKRVSNHGIVNIKF